MNERKSLLDWFEARRESVIMGGIKAHARAVHDTVAELNRAVNHLCKGQKDKALESMKRLLVEEKEADKDEQFITEELSKGELESKERGDLLRLVRKMDSIADWSKESAMNLQLLLEANVQVPADLWQRYCRMTDTLEKAATELRISLDYLGLNNDEAAKHEREVERLEHALDDMYFATKKEILFANIDPKAVFLLRDMLHGIENSADSCKDVADMIHILITSELHMMR